MQNYEKMFCTSILLSGISQGFMRISFNAVTPLNGTNRNVGILEKKVMETQLMRCFRAADVIQIWASYFDTPH